MDLPGTLPGIFRLFLLLLFFLDLAGLLQSELIQPLGQCHAPGSGRVSDGEGDHVMGHHLCQLHTAKLSVQLTGQLETGETKILCHFKIPLNTSRVTRQAVYNAHRKHLHEKLLLLLLGLSLTFLIDLIATG